MKQSEIIDISVKEYANLKGCDITAFQKAIEEAKNTAEIVKFNDIKLWLLGQYDDEDDPEGSFIGRVWVFDGARRYILSGTTKVVYNYSK